MKELKDTNELSGILKDNPAVLVYFSHKKCNVCKTLKPKIEEHFKTNYTKFELVYADIESLPENAAKHSVFTVPVIIIFFENKEFIRKARAVGIQEISEAVKRPYRLIFD